MPKLTADEVLTQQHVRGFITYGPPQPGNPALYYGIRAQYFSITGVSNPVQGGISPINAPDPLRRKAYRRIGRQIEPPDFGTYDLTLAHKHGTVPKALGDLATCEIGVHLTTGKCKNPSDLNRGYESWLYILSGGEVTDRDNGDMFPMDSDEMLTTALTITTAEQYAVGPLAFGETAGTEVNAEVIDLAFAPAAVCVDCDAGASRIYAITRAIGGSPTYQAEVVYSVDGGATWTNVNITGLSAASSPTAIDVVGDYVVVLANSANALYYAAIDPDTGIPGTWSSVTSGFATGGNPNDLWVASPNEVYIVGNGGYIYRSRDITAGVTVLSAGTVTTQNLLRVHGQDEAIVAVGNAQQVVISRNRGTSWATPQTAVPVSANATAVCVKSDTHYWVGFGNGAVYYTLTGGKTWAADSDAAPSATAIQDIVFPTAHVGYLAYTVSGPDARLATTVDGGDSWATGPARVLGTFPVHDRTNRIATPTSDAQTSANVVALGGLAGDGSEGVIYLGAANIV